MYSGAPQLQQPRPPEDNTGGLVLQGPKTSKEKKSKFGTGSKSKNVKGGNEIDRLKEELNRILAKINEGGHSVEFNKNGVLVLQGDPTTDPVESPDGGPVTPRASTTFNEEPPIPTYVKSYEDILKQWDEMINTKEEGSSDVDNVETAATTLALSGGGNDRTIPTNSNSYIDRGPDGSTFRWGAALRDVAIGGPAYAGYKAFTGQYTSYEGPQPINTSDTTFGTETTPTLTLSGGGNLTKKDNYKSGSIRVSDSESAKNHPMGGNKSRSSNKKNDKKDNKKDGRDGLGSKRGRFSS